MVIAVGSGCNLVYPLDVECGDHDEDGDTIFDLCDNCPGIPNTDQLDTTEDQAPGGIIDGVGDVCDPNPNTSDQVVEVISFFGGAENQRWEAYSTTTGWTFDEESAVFTSTEPGEQAAVRSKRAQPSRPFVLEYEVVIDEPYDLGFIGVRADTSDVPDPAPTHFGVECGVLHAYRQDADGNVILDPDGNPIPIAMSSSGHRNVMAPALEGGLLIELPAKSDRYRVQMRYDVPPDMEGDGNEDLRCIVQHAPGAEGTQSQINYVSPLPPGDRVALGGLTASARITYLVFYKPIP